jgi:hypothetical protein
LRIKRPEKRQDVGSYDSYDSYLQTNDVDRVKQLAAERIVNSIEDLPSHYVDSDFWRVARPKLLDAAGGDRTEPVRQALGRLAQHTDRLLRELRALRERLCDEYDLPPAPF